MTDFNSIDHINSIITRFLNGTASAQDTAELNSWLKEKDNRTYFDQLNKAYQASLMTQQFDAPRVDQAWSKLNAKIEHPKTASATNPSRTFFLSPLRVAASIGFITAFSFLIFSLLPDSTVKEKSKMVLIKAADKNAYFLLPDKSKVWLNKNSTLEYPVHFDGDSRLVVLTGEAFFDVESNGSPFIVQTEKMQVHVKGTRFNVQAYNNEKAVKTTLEEGKVELQLIGVKAHYAMDPGEQIILNKELNKITKETVDPSYFTAWKEERLVFDNARLKDIAAKLQNRFRVHISVHGTQAQNERLSLTIENESLEEVLESIRLSSRLQVTNHDKGFIIYP